MTQGLVIFAVKGVECQPGYITESSYFVKSTSQVLLSCPCPCPWHTLVSWKERGQSWHMMTTMNISWLVYFHIEHNVQCTSWTARIGHSNSNCVVRILNRKIKTLISQFHLKWFIDILHNSMTSPYWDRRNSSSVEIITLLCWYSIVIEQFSVQPGFISIRSFFWIEKIAYCWSMFLVGLPYWKLFLGN